MWEALAAGLASRLACLMISLRIGQVLRDVTPEIVLALLFREGVLIKKKKKNLSCTFLDYSVSTIQNAFYIVSIRKY